MLDYGSAQRRIDAARLIRDVPEIADLIQSGEINLNQTTLVQKAAREVKRVRAHKVTAEDKRTLLNGIAKMKERESQKEVASFFDLPVVEAQVQKVQADESVRIELTLSKEAFEKLKQAQALLAHSVPTQDLAVFLEYVSDKVIKQKTSYRASNIPTAANEVKSTTTTAVALEEQQLVQVNEQQQRQLKVKSETKANSLSVSVRKKVLKDQGCCQFKDSVTGRVCGSKWFVQADHKHSQWAGGDHSEANLQVLCGQHNRLKYAVEAHIRNR